MIKHHSRGETDEEPSVIATHEQVVFADTDTLSAFLWRGAFNYLIKLFQKYGIEIIIPQQVIDELKYNLRTQQNLAAPVLMEIKKKTLVVKDIEICTKEYATYTDLTQNKALGSGESAALSMALHSDKPASIASSNLRDVRKIAEANHLKIWTTATVIRACVDENIMTENRATELWKKMIENNVKLPYATYAEYVEKGTI